MRRYVAKSANRHTNLFLLKAYLFAKPSASGRLEQSGLMKILLTVGFLMEQS